MKRRSRLALILTVFVFLTGCQMAETAYSQKTIHVEEVDVSKSGDGYNVDGYLGSTYKKVIFVGDSRTAGLANSVLGTSISSDTTQIVFQNDEGTEVYVCQIGKGLSWFVNEAAYQISQMDTKDSAVIINLGVNDLGNVDEYVKEINKYAEEWEGDVYYAAVMPIVENGVYDFTNSDIEAFNRKLKQGLSEDIGWIDTYSHVKSRLDDGTYYSGDGLHFSGDGNVTNLGIHSFMLSQLK